MNLFFDTETTGVQRRTDHVVQLAWILTDEKGNELEKGNFLVKPNGFAIPRRASQVHGISHEDAKENGHPLEEVLLEFSACAEKATTIIAHNLSFDYAILESEYKRNDIPFPLLGKIQVCTMRLSSKWCRLPRLNGQTGFKPPKLDELYFKLFGEGFADAHDALSDTRACLAAYFELVKLGVIASPQDRKYPRVTKAEPKSSNSYKKGYEDGMKVGYKAGYVDAGKSILKAEGEERKNLINELLFNDNRQVRIGAAAYKNFSCHAILALFVCETLEEDFLDIMGSFGVRDADLLTLNAQLRETDISRAVDFLLDFHAKTNEKSLGEDGHDLNLINTIFSNFFEFTSADFFIQFSTSEGIPTELIVPMLFYVRLKINREKDSGNLKPTEQFLRNHTEFDLIRYQDYLRYIRDDDKGEPYFGVWFHDVVIDPDVPEELLDDIFDMDEAIQESILMDPRAPKILFDSLFQFDWSIQESIITTNKLSENQLEQYINAFYLNIEGLNIFEGVSDIKSKYEGEELESIRLIDDFLTADSSALPEHILKIARRKRKNLNIVSY